MATEVWFRNPKNYIRELVEAGSYNIAWDRGMLVKFSMDPHKHASLYLPESPWRILLLGAQGTMELGPKNDEQQPVAVYPTWCFGEPNAVLEEMMTHPAGQVESLCFDTRIPVDERAVWGQKHMVVIAEGPPGGATSPMGRKFYRYLAELQEDYPDCTIYLHNSYSYRYAFGLGFGAADIDPRLPAQKGNVVLPSGEIVPFEKAQKNPKWLAAVGMTVDDIAVPRMRCIFNIKSAEWAGKNYGELFNFRVKRDGGTTADVTTPAVAYRGAGTRSFLTSGGGKSAAKPGDMIACDTCSLKDSCKYEREGAVCSVPDTDGSSLSRFFKTRNADLIIDGLGEIMKINADRIEEARAEEAVVGLNPEVTKMLNQLFAQGTQLAKILDPNLRGGTKVNVNVGVAGSDANVSIEQTSSKQVVANVVRSLEAQGYARDQITPQMVQGVLEGMISPANQKRAIEGTVISDGNA